MIAFMKTAKIIIIASTCLSLTPFMLFADDIRSDILSSLEGQLTENNGVSYITEGTVVRVRPALDSEAAFTVESDSQVKVIDEMGFWAEVSLVSNEDITGFVLLSSMTNSVSEKRKTSGNQSLEIDLSDVKAKTPGEIALAQSRRVEQEKQRKNETDQAFANRLKANWEAEQREKEARELAKAREERIEAAQLERELAESESTNDSELARQWKALSQLPDRITRTDSWSQIENERQRALRMKEGRANSNTSSVTNGSDSQSSGGGGSGKMYEPQMETALGENGSWFAKQPIAEFYARLSAVNDISAACRERGARTDRPTTDQTRSGDAPERWSFGSPQCRQGGSGGDQFWCRVEVAGTCYRRP